MAKAQRQPMSALAEYLPDATAADVIHYLETYKVHLTITQARSSILGNYRNPYGDHHHRISVNGNLNKYSFLITLLHELAHLLTFERYQHKVAPHGKEWKRLYAEILSVFLRKSVFPEDIHKEIERSLHNPGASSCAEPGLMRVLKNYDPPKDLVFVEQLKPGEWFVTRDNLCFQMVAKRRTRYLCTQYKTGKQYLFNGLYEVKRIANDLSATDTQAAQVSAKAEPPSGYTHIENILPGAWFMAEDQLTYKLEKKRRTRYLCTQARTGKQYLFSAGYLVKPLPLG